MSWRTVVISNRAKLDLKMGQLVVRSEDRISKINLDEVSVLVIENSAISITGCLISALNNHKIKVIFCDETRNPCCELVPCHGSHDSSLKIRNQISWNENVKLHVWTEIVSEKINLQSRFLADIGKYDEARLLSEYIEEMEFGDVTNREGHAAKVYFNALFGMDFTRTRDCVKNAALNYGYSIILSAFNRECSSNGYITQLGLFHNNMYNHFNLSCDLMEPYRILVDRCVYYNDFVKFEKEEKHKIIDILNQIVVINGEKNTVANALKIYCKSVFNALNDNNVSLIKFYKYEV